MRFDENLSINWLFDQFTQKFPALTSDWTKLELFRAVKKQINLGAIPKDAFDKICEFIITDLRQLEAKKEVVFLRITRKQILLCANWIGKHNLYSADSLHFVQANEANAKYFVTFDRNFRGVDDSIPILNPQNDQFKAKISGLLKIT